MGNGKLYGWVDTSYLVYIHSGGQKKYSYKLKLDGMYWGREIIR